MRYITGESFSLTLGNGRITVSDSITQSPFSRYAFRGKNQSACWKTVTLVRSGRLHLLKRHKIHVLSWLISQKSALHRRIHLKNLA